jgi:chloramphenicol-sensitive protein RarD
LVSVLLGIIFLKEKLNLAQGAAFFLSALGVLNMVLSVGGFPWISLTLAFSFGFYGLIKKLLPISAISSIALETAMLMPIMLLYEFYLASNSASVYQNISLGNFLLLLGSGIVTATPLMLFSASTRFLSLKALGFLQYMSPTLSMIIGIFVYKESFTFAHFISFGLIWLGLAIFSASQFGSSKPKPS